MAFDSRLSRVASAAVFAAACGTVLALPISAQAPNYTSASYTPPKSSYVPPKTPWGDPDIQGVYDYQDAIPMERPAQFAGRAKMTPAELKDWLKARTPNQDACGFGTRKNEKCTDAQLKQVGAYNEFWDNRNLVFDDRTSLIVDPPDGKFPALTPEAAKIQAAAVGPEAGLRRFSEFSMEALPHYTTWEDFNAVTRCIAEETPNGVQMYNSGTYLMQVPGWVLIVRERLDTRIIPLDNRPHVGGAIRAWEGDSRGHFDGNTLVVETTNFTNKQDKSGVGSTIPGGVPMGNIRLVEHFVPVSDKRIEYYATVEDPKAWVKPWTFMLPWEKDPNYTLYEYACQEGNISVGNALRGDRAKEARGEK